MLEGKTVAVVVPAFDEEALVGTTIRGIPAFVDRIFVVDDASRDGTVEAARAVGDPRVAVLTHDRNAGVGGAIVTGYRRSVAEGIDVACVMAADNQMDPSDLERIALPVARGEVEYANAIRLHGREPGDSRAARSGPHLSRLRLPQRHARAPERLERARPRRHRAPRVRRRRTIGDQDPQGRAADLVAPPEGLLLAHAGEVRDQGFPPARLLLRPRLPDDLSRPRARDRVPVHVGRVRRPLGRPDPVGDLRHALPRAGHLPAGP